MTKSIILSSIKKVFLDPKDVDNYYVFWKIEDNKLKLESVVVAYKSSTYCVLEAENFSMIDQEFIIRQPDKLIKLINISEDNVTLEIEKKYDHRLIIKDSSFEQEFILCDRSGIPVELPTIEEPLSYDFTLPIDATFIEKFLKVKKANGSETVSIEIKDRKARFEVGDNNSYSNKSKFFIEQDGMFDMDKILFSSDIIQIIFERNKSCEGSMQVFNEGLMKITFNEVIDEISTTATYFLIALDQL